MQDGLRLLAVSEEMPDVIELSDAIGADQRLIEDPALPDRIAVHDADGQPISTYPAGL